MNKALIIEDDESTLDVLQLLFQDEGFQVHAFDDFSNIKDKVVSVMPNFIILDICLGEENGIDICRELKGNETTSDIKIILSSASNVSEESIIECQADSFIAKPFDIDELAEEVKAILSKPNCGA